MIEVFHTVTRYKYFCIEIRVIQVIRRSMTEPDPKCKECQRLVTSETRIKEALIHQPLEKYYCSAVAHSERE